MSGVGHNWDVFTTDSPYTSVLEGLPTQLALALRRLGFALPGNLAAFVDDFECTETELDQAVSEADTTANVIGVGTVSAYITLQEIPSVVVLGRLLLYSPLFLRLFSLSLLRLELSHQWLLSKIRGPSPVLARRWRVKLWMSPVLQCPLTQSCLLSRGHRTKKDRNEWDQQAKCLRVAG